MYEKLCFGDGGTLNFSYSANLYLQFFTGRNEVVAKVIFLHLSVIHSVNRGGLP